MLHERSTPFIIPWLLALSALLLTLLACGLAYSDVRSLSEVSVDAEITSSNLAKTESDGNSDRWVIPFRYKYSVDGENYESDGNRYVTGTVEEAESLFADYALGKTVSVHFHPDSPGEATTGKGLLFIPSLIILGIAGLAYALSRWLSRRIRESIEA